MSRVTQHLPGYFDPVSMERKETTADTLDELLAIPWVSGWKSDPAFFRFSITDDSLKALMVELNEGRNWWVIAYLENPGLYDLPKREAKK